MKVSNARVVSIIGELCYVLNNSRYSGGMAIPCCPNWEQSYRLTGSLTDFYPIPYGIDFPFRKSFRLTFDKVKFGLIPILNENCIWLNSLLDRFFNYLFPVIRVYVDIEHMGECVRSLIYDSSSMLNCNFMLAKVNCPTSKATNGIFQIMKQF